MPGRSLELFFVEGRPAGMVTASLVNWTGHVLALPRTRLKESMDRPEESQPGIYLLLGETDAGDLAYIGESEELSTRLKQRATAKDWWSRAVLVTSSADNLDRAHIRYLEARLVEEARQAGVVSLANATSPVRARLSEASRADMEEFLATLLIVLPALRIDMFVDRKRPKSDVQSAKPLVPVFTLETPKHGIRARAVREDGEFVVEKGSRAQARWIGAKDHNLGYQRLHEQLRQSGVLVEDGNLAVFAESYSFSSASAAAAVVNGRCTAGPLAWKLPDGRTYKQWEAGQLETAS